MHRVSQLNDLGPDLFEVEVEREGLVYQPADCTLLIHKDGINSRPYIFSSHPDQDHLSFFFRRISGGFSDWLASLRPGDQLGVGTPFGNFHPRGENEVWLATGTGLAPFLSVLRSHTNQGPLECWYGVRTRKEACFLDFLKSKTSLKVFFSRETPQNPYERQGRLSQFFGELPVGIDLEYYLCGQGEMIREGNRRLVSKGVPADKLHGESFY
ncbi:MAG: FAD-dependent oxidoreductase [Spirochaetales bacterium]|nr:FAD-dependent oxidoreductase [Spirochaetales bacterium]